MAAHQASHPWDSPGKNTGVGCHFLPQGMKVKSESEVPQSCPTLNYPMDSSQGFILLFSLKSMLLLLLSRFSRVRLCATPQTAAHEAPPVPGILQARTLEWVAISFSHA